MSQWSDEMIISILTVINLVTAVSIVVLVLLQRGKGADMGAAFGVALPNRYSAVKDQQLL